MVRIIPSTIRQRFRIDQDINDQDDLDDEINENDDILTPPPGFDESVSETPSSSRRYSNSHPPLKYLGLRLVNSRQYFILRFFRDLALIPSVYGVWNCFDEAKQLHNLPGSPFATSSARSSEFLLAAIWAIVAGYLSYSVLDGLMIRWIVIYTTPAAFVRMFCSSALIITIIQILLSIFDKSYCLPVWILVSCLLTVAYIIQNFVTSNLAFERSRSVDIYHVAVFAVVPLGVASFLTMIGLLRNLMILRVEMESREVITPFVTGMSSTISGRLS